MSSDDLLAAPPDRGIAAGPWPRPAAAATSTVTLTEVHQIVGHVTRAQIDVVEMDIRAIAGWTEDGRWVRGVQMHIAVADMTGGRALAADLHLTRCTDRRWAWHGWRWRSGVVPIRCLVEVEPTPEFLAAMSAGLAVDITRSTGATPC